MKITSVASSSKGCSYIVDSGGFQILIDCGVRLKKIREYLPDNSFQNVVACLVSHSHGDHSGHLKQLERETNVPIYCTEGTANRFEIDVCQIIQDKKIVHFTRQFRTQALELSHDVPCFGFFIYVGSEKLFYATDTGDIKYKIPGLKTLMIECNHSFDILIDSDINKAALKRICDNHLSIEQVCEFVSRHPDLEEIHLLHMSAGHGDAKLFKRIVQDVSGCIVRVADE